MNHHPGNGPDENTPGPERPTSIVVPGPPPREPDDAEPATEEQMVRDLGSASRSCVAIIVVLVLMALVLCVFLFWAIVIQ